jgi:ribonuclease E
MQRVMRARVWRTGVHLFMTKKLLIDASHAEETRVVVLDGNRLEDFDVETATRKQIKGNIYLAKVIRVDPSLQAAFVEYGGRSRLSPPRRPRPSLAVSRPRARVMSRP